MTHLKLVAHKAHDCTFGLLNLGVDSQQIQIPKKISIKFDLCIKLEFN